MSGPSIHNYGPEVDALAEVLGDIRVAGARQEEWWTNDEDHHLLIRVLRAECLPWAEGLLASEWLAARDAVQRQVAAEERDVEWRKRLPDITRIREVEARQAVTAVLAKVRAFHDAWGHTEADDIDQLALWEDLGRLLEEAADV